MTSDNTRWIGLKSSFSITFPSSSAYQISPGMAVYHTQHWSSGNIHQSHQYFTARGPPASFLSPVFYTSPQCFTVAYEKLQRINNPASPTFKIGWMALLPLMDASGGEMWHVPGVGRLFCHTAADTLFPGNNLTLSTGSAAGLGIATAREARHVPWLPRASPEGGGSRNIRKRNITGASYLVFLLDLRVKSKRRKIRKSSMVSQHAKRKRRIWKYIERGGYLVRLVIFHSFLPPKRKRRRIRRTSNLFHTLSPSMASLHLKRKRMIRRRIGRVGYLVHLFTFHSFFIPFRGKRGGRGGRRGEEEHMKTETY